MLVVDDDPLVGACVAPMLQASDTPCAVDVMPLDRLRLDPSWCAERSEVASVLPLGGDGGASPAACAPVHWDATRLWGSLAAVQEWDCVNVSTPLAPALAALIEAHLGTPVRRFRDVYLALPRPVAVVRSPYVRLLTLDDLGLLALAPPELRASGLGRPEVLLEGGHVAGAVVGGYLVSIAHTFPPVGPYADTGVYTLAERRGCGFATAAASLVTRCAQDAGHIPLWRTEEDNLPSLRLARKLGFAELTRRTYLVPDRAGLPLTASGTATDAAARC